MPDLRLAATAHDAREAADRAGMLFRLTRDLPGYLRVPLTLDHARTRVHDALAHRERRFLDLVDRTIYRQPKSPYRRLLAHAGCEPGDLHRLVAQEGVEGALHVLANRGVYVSFDEFKGRRPAVRGSARFTFADRDFDNRLARGHHYLVLTSGSSGRLTPVRRTLGSVTDISTAIALAVEAHGLIRPRHVFWLGGSPSMALAVMKLDQPITRWFYPIHPLPGLARAALLAIRALARLGGRRMPMPEHADAQEATRIAHWLLCQVDVDQPILLTCTVSTAVRIASAAAALGRTLEGVTFQCRSEPTSAARRRLIEDVGAGVLVDYSCTEIPALASGCPAGIAPDDVHLWPQLCAAIQRDRPVSEGGPPIQALLLTTLSPHAPKIGLNLEVGDSARIEERNCGCLLGSLGLTTHLSEIRSFEKLSSEGTTFARSNVLQILEEILPGRHGGSALDYQLVEEETSDGSTRLVLRIHPGVGAIDEAAVRATLLQELARGSLFEQYHARLLERAGSIMIRRLPPLATPAGKVLPFHQARQPQGVTRA